MTFNDISLIECLGGLEINTQQGAIKTLICLKTHGIIVYWSDRWGRIIARSKSGRRGGLKSLMKDIMTTLKINSKEDWERIKREFEL